MLTLEKGQERGKGKGGGREREGEGDGGVWVRRVGWVMRGSYERGMHILADTLYS